MAKVKRGRPRGEATKSQPIRMPVRLLEQVRKEAATRGHSVTQIIVEKLEADYAPEPGFEPHARDLMILLELVIRSFLPMTDEHGKPLAEWWNAARSQSRRSCSRLRMSSARWAQGAM